MINPHTWFFLFSTSKQSKDNDIMETFYLQTTAKYQIKIQEPCQALTLNEPSSPNCIVQTNLVSPQQTQTLERLPLGRDDLPTARRRSKTSFVHEKCEIIFVFSQGLTDSLDTKLLLWQKSVLLYDKHFPISSFNSDLSPCWHFFHCPLAGWVLRRGALMWGAQRVARKQLPALKHAS